MASTTLADYQVLFDGRFTLGGNTTSKKLENFEVPSDFAFESGVRKPILAFKIRLLEDNTAYKVRVNSREVIHQTGLDKSHTRGWWEAFSAKTAFPNNTSFPHNNHVEIIMTNGKAVFSDVVIWYQIKRNG